MKKLLLAAIILATTNSYAFEVKCEAAVGPRNGRPTTEVAVTHKDGQAYIYQTIKGYTFNGSCSEETCDISINNEEKIKGFVATNGAFSKLNDNSISISHFGSDDIIAEITCQKIK